MRQVEKEALSIAQTGLSRLQEKGVPSYFGEQRFGIRHNTHRLGECLVRNNASEFVAEFLGRPQPHESIYIQTARQLVDEGRWIEALTHWPDKLSDEKQVLRSIIKADGQLEIAFSALNKKLKSLFVSAFQSQLFNQLLAQRIGSLDRLETGDVAYIHGKGASFIVDDPVSEQPRADQFEISPSGPLFGPKVMLAEGEPGRREKGLLAEQGLTPADFSISGVKIRGTRRPYRFKIKDAKTWWEDDGLMVSFELEPGAYATTVMAEIMKGQ